MQAERDSTPPLTVLSGGQRVVPGVIVQTPSGLLEIRRLNGNTISARPRTREWEGNTPSVWGIDLDRGRGRAGGLRDGTPAVVVSSINMEPVMWGRRRGVDDENGVGGEMEGLPRYEEPPPGYEKVMEEGGVRPAQLGEVGEGSRDMPGMDLSAEFLTRERVQIREEPLRRSDLGENHTTVQMPTLPSPTVTRSRPITSI